MYIVRLLRRMRQVIRFNMKNIVAIMLLAVVISCRPGPPWQAWMYKGPPPGQEYTPLYVDGWKDGCASGTSASANAWYSFFAGFKQDPIKAQNRVYYKGWKDAFDYCQRYIHQYNARRLF